MSSEISWILREGIHKKKLKSSAPGQVNWTPRGYPRFTVATKSIYVGPSQPPFPLPDEMLVNRFKFASSHLCIWLNRGTMKKCKNTTPLLLHPGKAYVVINTDTPIHIFVKISLIVLAGGAAYCRYG